MLRPDILRRQRQILQQRLYKVHISITIQVTRDISNIKTIVQWLSVTWFTCSLRVRAIFPPFWGTMPRKLSRLTEMHKLSLREADLHVVSQVSLYVPVLHLKWFWGPSLTLKLFVLIQSCYMPSYVILGSIVFELHDMRMVCLLKGATPRMGCKYGSFLGSNRLHSLFRSVWGLTSQGQMPFIGRARASGPACLQQTSLRAWWTDSCIFLVVYSGLLGEHLG